MDEDIIGGIIALIIVLAICLSIVIGVVVYHNQTINLEKYRLQMQTFGEPINENKIEE